MKAFKRKLLLSLVILVLHSHLGAIGFIPHFYDSQKSVNRKNIEYAWYLDGIALDGDATFGAPLVATKGGSTGINLNDGTEEYTLTLSTDILLGGGILIRGSGSIRGTDENSDTHSLVLTGSTTLIGGTVNISNDLVINGQGNVLDFNSQSLAIGNDKTLTLRNIVLRTVDTNSITWGNAGSKLILDDVVIELIDNFEVETGLVDLYGTNVITGKGYSFVFNSGTISPQANSILSFDHGTTFDVNDGTFSPNASSILHFNGCTVDMAGADLTVNNGMVLFENKVEITGDNTFYGDGADMRVLSGARVILGRKTTFQVS